MRRLRDDYGCKVPTTFDELLALPGVGRKSANLIISGYTVMLNRPSDRVYVDALISLSVALLVTSSFALGYSRRN